MSQTIENFLDVWIDTTDKIPRNMTFLGYTRTPNMIYVKDWPLAFRNSKRGFATHCFLNSAGADPYEVPNKIFLDRVSFMKEYLNNISSNNDDFNFFLFPFYPLLKNGVALSSLNVLDYDLETQTILFSRDRANHRLLLFNASDNLSLPDFSIEKVDKSVTYFGDLLNV